MKLCELDKLSGIEINNANRINLADIKNIHIDPSQNILQRMENYMEQIKNPYCFLCGDSIVKLRFEKEGKELKYKMKKYLENIKNS
jgi:hypothetical protein